MADPKGADMEASTAPRTFINGDPIPDEDAESEETSPPDDIATAAEEQLDDLEIQIASRDWLVEGTIPVQTRTGGTEEVPFSRIYSQKPLSYGSMLKFTGLIGDQIFKVMEQGITVESVLSDAQTIAGAFGGDGLSREDFGGVDAFVRGLAKLASYLPDVIERCQCIWLRVPLHEQPIVSEIWSRSPEDGGLSMQDGEDMLNLFIAQNYKELEDFFVVRGPRVLAQASKARKRFLGPGVQPQ